MKSETLQKLKTYIKAELGNSMLYRVLARMAPDRNGKQLLMEFAEDEQAHAEKFQKIYRNMTGRSYNPEIEPPDISMGYRKIVLDRILDESGDFRKYNRDYAEECKNMKLKKAYYNAAVDENVHAQRLSYLADRME